MPILPGMNKIALVIDAAGGIPALASELSVKAPTIYQWKNGTRKVSPRLALAITQKYPNLATVHDLRPDIFGPPAAGEGKDAA